MHNQSQQQRSTARFQAYQFASHCPHLMVFTTVAEGRVNTQRFSDQFPSDDLPKALLHTLEQYARMFAEVGNTPQAEVVLAIRNYYKGAAARAHEVYRTAAGEVPS